MVKRCFAGVALVPIVSVVLTGCASKPYSPLAATEPVDSIPASVEPPPEIRVLPHEPPVVVGLDNIDNGVSTIPITTNVPASKKNSPFGSGWIPLRTWTDRCGLGAPERVINAGITSYRITTRGGICKLTMGSRLAQWNGLSVWLGFAPQVMGGEFRIHALDAEKTLQPLAEMNRAEPPTGRTVVLDPGHGGADSGTRSARHEFEKHFTLDWAFRTERLLTNAGWKVFLTRRSDVDVALPDRVSFADQVHADLFISLHFNSTFPQTRPSGIETYCLTPWKMPSTLARGYADDERALFPNNAFDVANMEWAMRMHRSLLKETGAHDDGIKRARFMSVLRYQNRPSILVEGGFLSNARDAANIGSGEYRQALATAIANALGGK